MSQLPWWMWCYFARWESVFCCAIRVQCAVQIHSTTHMVHDNITTGYYCMLLVVCRVKRVSTSILFYNSPIYNEYQTQLAKVLTLLWKRAHEDDSNDTPPQLTSEFQVDFPLLWIKVDYPGLTNTLLMRSWLDWLEAVVTKVPFQM